MNKNNTGIQKKFGRMIREQRKKLCLSQEQLALKADLHRTYIADIERGHRNVSLQNIERLTIALEISLSRFFELVEGISEK